jgi:hypothetical protein
MIIPNGPLFRRIRPAADTRPAGPSLLRSVRYGSKRVVRLTGVASKKSKQRTHGKGLSGNPQKRAQQLLARAAPGGSVAAGNAMSAGQAAGAARAWSWWPGSHQKIIAQAREAEWPTRLLDIETLAGRLAGDEFHARVNAPGSASGLDPAGWLRELTEAAFNALSDDFEGGGTDWPRLWGLCCGIADAEGAAELDAEADGLAGGGVDLGPGFPVPWYRPADGGDVLVARDAYGDRFLLAAPFSDPTRPAEADHWYAWDLDWCVSGTVVGAGAYESADSALAEWAAAVGPASTSAELAPAPRPLALRLLAPALGNSLQVSSVFGDEPVELFRELPRLLRRAAALEPTLGRPLNRGRSAAAASGRDAAIDGFLDWHAGRAWTSPDAREAAEAALELLLEEWGPDVPPDDEAFYACSPHRIEVCAMILRDAYDPDAVNEALALLPAWVQWCAGRAKLDALLTDRALAAARAEAAVPAVWGQVVKERERPFRRSE